MKGKLSGKTGKISVLCILLLWGISFVFRLIAGMIGFIQGKSEATLYNIFFDLISPCALIGLNSFILYKIVDKWFYGAIKINDRSEKIIKRSAFEIVNLVYIALIAAFVYEMIKWFQGRYEGTGGLFVVVLMGIPFAIGIVSVILDKIAGKLYGAKISETRMTVIKAVGLVFFGISGLVMLALLISRGNILVYCA